MPPRPPAVHPPPDNEKAHGGAHSRSAAAAPSRSTLAATSITLETPAAPHQPANARRSPGPSGPELGAAALPGSARRRCPRRRVRRAAVGNRCRTPRVRAAPAAASPPNATRRAAADDDSRSPDSPTSASPSGNRRRPRARPSPALRARSMTAPSADGAPAAWLGPRLPHLAAPATNRASPRSQSPHDPAAPTRGNRTRQDSLPARSAAAASRR
jgi:hypothetical protein